MNCRFIYYSVLHKYSTNVLRCATDCVGLNVCYYEMTDCYCLITEKNRNMTYRKKFQNAVIDGYGYRTCMIYSINQ